jgi:hypothetical protein
MPACKGQADKEEKMMKKKIGSVVRIGLVALLLAVVAVGMVFALNPIAVNCDNYLDSSWNRTVNIEGSVGPRVVTNPAKGLSTTYPQRVSIDDVSRSPVGINVTYSYKNERDDDYHPGKVEFKFTAYFDSGIKPVTWTNVENLTKNRKSSTWKFTLQNYLLCYRLDVSARKL